MKKLVSVLCVLMLLFAAVGCSAEERAHNRAVSDFKLAVKSLNISNAELENLVIDSEGLIDSGQMPLHKPTITDLKRAISALSKAKVEAPEMPTSTEDIIAETATINASHDYSALITDVQKKRCALERSIQQMEQVTNPSGEFVMKRIEFVSGVWEIEAATPSNDPNGMLNKPDGYTSAIFFSSLLVDQSLVEGTGVADRGTLGGGCIEVFPDVESAVARDSYIAIFDDMPSIAAGSHYVVGTIVIRISDHLTVKQQETLTKEIEAALIELR